MFIKLLKLLIIFIILSLILTMISKQYKSLNLYFIMSLFVILLVLLLLTCQSYKIYITEGFESENGSKLLDKYDQDHYYKKHFTNSNLVALINTYNDNYKINNLLTKIPDILNKNRTLLTNITTKNKIMDNRKRLSNIYSIDLGNYTYQIEPRELIKNTSNIVNSFNNFNQSNFSIVWSMKFDSNLLNTIELQKRIQENELVNDTYKYNILYIKNYYNNDIPFYLKVNYCAHRKEKVNMKETNTDNIKYDYTYFLEVELDDNLNYNYDIDDKEFMNKFINRYNNDKKRIRIFNTNDFNNNMVNTNIINFMTDNKAHTFNLTHVNNKLMMTIDDHVINSSHIEKTNEINNFFTINSLNKVLKREAEDKSESINFFSSQVNFNIANRNPGIFLNKTEDLMNSLSYLTFFGIYDTNLKFNEYTEINNNINMLNDKYESLSTSIIQNSLDYFDHLNTDYNKLKEQSASKQSCSFNNKEVCTSCSNSNVKDWSNLKDIFNNSSKECQSAVINHCTNNPDDNACPFDNHILNKLSDTIDMKIKDLPNAPNVVNAAPNFPAMLIENFEASKSSTEFDPKNTSKSFKNEIAVSNDKNSGKLNFPEYNALINKYQMKNILTKV